ncbi:FAD-dependent oxidoreductase [Adlercreutzia rubneri]
MIRGEAGRPPQGLLWKKSDKGGIYDRYVETSVSDGRGGRRARRSWAGARRLRPANRRGAGRCRQSGKLGRGDRGHRRRIRRRGRSSGYRGLDNGAQVLVLDASDTPGGATSINGGVIQCGGSSVQKAAGVEDSADAWFECLKVAMVDGFDEDHVRRLTQEGAEHIEWLLGLGAEIPAEIHPTDTHSIPESGLYYSDASCELFPDKPLTPRGHVVVGQGGGFLKALRSGADERGIEIRTGCPVTDLVQDGEGHVTGVVAKDGSKSKRIRATKGVVIATGHFNENEEMVNRHIPMVKRNPRSVITGHPSALGDGQRMAEAVGAEMVGMGDISPSMYTAGAETSIHSMMVNLRCQRFWSEQGYTNNFRGTRLTQQPDHQGFAIFDEKIRATFGEVDAAEAEFKADTIEGLAEACGLDPVLLARSVERYNQLCETGVDLEYGKHPEFLDVISEPPFFAMPLAYVWMTSGAIRINENAQVVKPSGEAIPGLYAAGIIAAGRMGKQNPGSGYNMMWNFYTGRLAGRTVAAEGESE